MLFCFPFEKKRKGNLQGNSEKKNTTPESSKTIFSWLPTTLRKHSTDKKGVNLSFRYCLGLLFFSLLLFLCTITSCTTLHALLTTIQ